MPQNAGGRRRGGRVGWGDGEIALTLANLLLAAGAGAALVVVWPHVVGSRASPAPASKPSAGAAIGLQAEGMLDNPCPAQPPPGAAPAELAASAAYQRQNDWAWLCRYRNDNVRIAQEPAPRVVFMGDSITEFWAQHDPGLFSPGNVDRGISGQTSPQMLVRFYQDVVALHPQLVHIMAGTNDLAGNTGPNSPDQFKNNIMAMVTLAHAHHIGVVLASIPPTVRFGYRPSIKPAPQIAALNAWLKAYAAAVGAVYADYHAVLAEADGRIKDRYSADGVHPNTLGYQAMRPVADAAIARASLLGAK